LELQGQWEGLPADMRTAMVEVGEKELKTTWEILPATLYICRAHIYNEWYTNFGDAPARLFPDGDLVPPLMG
jgi:hypothetical protein